ncbi:MAG: hypothetical protein JSU81_09625 [Candidatus Coatesbacteria bacterium]|nr:MAG: hypothetical protein JSU81_09625 [Candidatus Coatesbacteria bacterium]
MGVGRQRLGTFGWLYAAAFLSAAPAAGEVQLDAAGGAFQYYYYRVTQPAAAAGLALAAAASYEREASACSAAAFYRGYDVETYEVGAEFRPRFYFHAAPARPYLAPTAGFWYARDEAGGYKIVGGGARAGGVLSAAEGRVVVDVYAAYRGRFNVDADELRPSFASELIAGAACDWRWTRRLGLRVEGIVLWPGFFAEKHGRLAEPGVAPFVLVGPTWRP